MVEPSPAKRRSCHDNTIQNANVGKRAHRSGWLSADIVKDKRPLQPFPFHDEVSPPHLRNSKYEHSYARGDISQAAKSFLNKIQDLDIVNFRHLSQSKCEKYTKIAHEEETIESFDDPKWYRSIHGCSGFKKGKMIAEMEDGVIECEEDSDTFQVYSNSSNYRIVDMAVCRCNCPNKKNICSHLIGVALHYGHKRRYLGRILALNHIESYINFLVKREVSEFVKKPNGIYDVVRHLRASNLFKNYKISYQVFSELLIGLIYRLYQQNCGLLPSIVAISGDSTDKKIQNVSKDEEEEEEIPFKNEGCQFKVDSIVPKVNSETVLDNYTSLDIIDMKERLNMMIYTINDSITDLEDSKYQKNDLILKNILRMLRDEYAPDATSEAVLRRYLSEFISSYFDRDNGSNFSRINVASECFYIPNCYALGSDICTCDASEQSSGSVNAINSASELRLLAIETISKAPLIVNLSKFTMWKSVFKNTLGPLCQFLVDEKSAFLQNYSFLYMNDEYIVKTMSPNVFKNDLEILEKIIIALNNFDSVSFVSTAITLLIKRRLICRLPDLSQIIEIIEKNTSFDSNDGFNRFILETLALIPSPLLLPFVKMLLKSALSKLSFVSNLFEFYNRIESDGTFFCRLWRLSKGFIDPLDSVRNLLEISRIRDPNYIFTCAKPVFDHKGETDQIGLNKPDEIFPPADIMEDLGDIKTTEETQSPLCYEETSAVDDLGSFTAVDCEKKRLIEDIRRSEFGIGLICDVSPKSPEQIKFDEKTMMILYKQKRRIAAAVKRLSEDLYNDKTHLQLELIQNADDNDYDCTSGMEPEVSFFFDSNAMIIINNECGFREADVRSICDIGSSSKADHMENCNKIGKFGIGFKSVFVLTNNPHIFSNGYNFMFLSGSSLEENVEYILPHWIDLGDSNNPFEYLRQKLQASSRECFEEFSRKLIHRNKTPKLTMIYLPLKAEYHINDQYKNYYKNFQSLKLETLLFLRKVNTIRFYNVTDSVETILQRKVLKSFTVSSKGSLSSLTVEDFKTIKLDLRMFSVTLPKVKLSEDISNRFFVINYKFNLSQQERKMLQISKGLNNDCSISIALLLANTYPEDYKCQLYNYLPVCDYGLRFMANADFVLVSNRQNILISDPWNELVTNKICDGFLGIIQLIRKDDLRMKNLYQSFLNAIPHENDGIDLFRYCCKRIISKLLYMEWVSVDGYENHFVKPNKALFLPIKPDINADENAEYIIYELFRNIFKPDVLKECCDLYYVDSKICTAYFKDLITRFGGFDLNFNFIVKVLSSLSNLIDLSRNLNDQAPALISVLYNIGGILYVVESLCEGNFKSLEGFIVLYDAYGNLFKISDKVHYVITELEINDSTLRVISHNILENKWNVDDYQTRVVRLLTGLGCTEITSDNFMRSLIIDKVKNTVSIFESSHESYNEELFDKSLCIFRLLVENRHTFCAFSRDDVLLIKRIPVKLDKGGFAALGNKHVKFCPRHMNCDPTTYPECSLYKYFQDVRSFYNDLMVCGIEEEILFISDDYLENSSMNVEHLYDFFSFFGVATFIMYDRLNISVDSDFSLDVEHVELDVNMLNECYQTRRNELSRFMRTTGIHTRISVNDWMSLDFVRIVNCLNNLLHFDVPPFEKIYKLSLLLYRIISHEFQTNKKFAVATVDFEGSISELGDSFFIYQVKNLPWIPYGEFIPVDPMHVNNLEDSYDLIDIKKSNSYEWQFTCLMTCNDRVCYNPLLFKSVDPKISNEILFRDTKYISVDLVKLLEIISCQIKDYSLSEGFLNVDPRQIFKSYSLCRIESAMIRCFSYCSFYRMHNSGNLLPFLKLIGSIYLDFKERIQSDDKQASVVINAFKNTELLIVTVGDKRCMKPYKSDDKNISIYKTILGQNSFISLCDVYESESPKLSDLIEFWKFVGVRKYIGLEGSLELLDSITQNSCFEKNEDIDTVFSILAHLYNILDIQEFVEILWNRCIIPVVNNTEDAFKYHLCLEGPRNVNFYDVALVKPCDGIITIKGQKSLELLKKFDANYIWTALSPTLGIYAAYKTLCCRYDSIHEIPTISEIWAQVLDALKAEDFKSKCNIRPFVDETALAWKNFSKNSLVIKLFVLLPLLPYVHYYLERNQPYNHITGDSKAFDWDNLEETIRRLIIIPTNEDLEFAYEYVNGNDVIRSKIARKRSLLYFSDGFPHIFVNKKLTLSISLPDFCGSSLDVVKSVNSQLQFLKDFPFDFFVNLSQLMIHNFSDMREIESDRKFVDYVDQPTEFMSKFLFTAYEMIRHQPKSLVDAFVYNFCSGNAPSKCTCRNFGETLDASELCFYGTHVKCCDNCDVRSLDALVLVLLEVAKQELDGKLFSNIDRCSFVSDTDESEDSSSTSENEIPWESNSLDSNVQDKRIHELESAPSNVPVEFMSEKSFNLSEGIAMDKFSSFDKRGLADISDTLVEDINTAQFVVHKSRESELVQEDIQASEISIEQRRSTGRIGEEFVYEILREIYKEEIACGNIRVVWHNETTESGFCYDISVHHEPEDEQTVYVEVKSSRSKKKGIFEISYREWLFAQTKGPKYEIYRVSGIGTQDLKVTKIVNPYLLWKTGNLGFCLTL